MLLLNTARSITVDGVTVFPDHADPNQFWYLPGPVSLARRPGGQPAFTFIQYQPAAVAGRSKGGGFVLLRLSPRLPQFSAWQDWQFADPAKARKSFDDALAEATTDAAGMAHLPLRPQRIAPGAPLLHTGGPGFETPGRRRRHQLALSISRHGRCGPWSGCRRRSTSSSVRRRLLSLRTPGTEIRHGGGGDGCCGSGRSRSSSGCPRLARGCGVEGAAAAAAVPIVPRAAARAAACRPRDGDHANDADQPAHLAHAHDARMQQRPCRRAHHASSRDPAPSAAFSAVPGASRLSLGPALTPLHERATVPAMPPPTQPPAPTDPASITHPRPAEPPPPPD